MGGGGTLQGSGSVMHPMGPALPLEEMLGAVRAERTFITKGANVHGIRRGCGEPPPPRCWGAALRQTQTEWLVPHPTRKWLVELSCCPGHWQNWRYEPPYSGLPSWRAGRTLSPPPPQAPKASGLEDERMGKTKGAGSRRFEEPLRKKALIFVTP